MAVKKNTPAKPAATKGDMKPADAYLNLKLVDSEGNTHTFNKGLPLFADNRLHRSLINAVKADPERVFELTGTVWIQPEEQAEDIPL